MLENCLVFFFSLPFLWLVVFYRDIRSEDLFQRSDSGQPSIGFKSVYNPDLHEELDLDYDEIDQHSYANRSTEDIVELYHRTTSLRARMDLIHMLLSR